MQLSNSSIQKTPAILLHSADDVAIALEDLAEGAGPFDELPRLVTPVPRGHKFAVRDLAAGQAIQKFGQVIAMATEAIPAGAHVHEHNAAMPDYSGARAGAGGGDWSPPAPPASTHFNGFRRESGKIGTRNYIAVISTVNCSATVARHAAAEAAAELGIAEDPAIDGIVAITHGAGCGMAASGEGFEMLQRTIWGYAAHPNMALVVLVGLGCEVMQVRVMLEAMGMAGSDRIRPLTIQQAGGTRRTIERIKAAIADGLPVARAARREPVPVAEITLALQCGGSDGYSGITANPALGLAADRLVAAGGTVILAETPEIYGAEHLLMARVRDPGVAEALAARIAWWEDYTARLGGQMNNNPTPGNKRGGLTTILEKSLGAVAKAGTSPLQEVIGYGAPATRRGFVFMDSPGYDPVSITGQVASGANVICFTTGRGSVYGCKPVPSLKLATNSEMFAHMDEDMDIDCGRILSAGESLEAMADVIIDHVIDTASGRPSKSECNGLGDNEFVPWITGAVM